MTPHARGYIHSAANDARCDLSNDVERICPKHDEKACVSYQTPRELECQHVTSLLRCIGQRELTHLTLSADGYFPSVGSRTDIAAYDPIISWAIRSKCVSCALVPLVECQDIAPNNNKQTKRATSNHAAGFVGLSPTDQFIHSIANFIEHVNHRRM